MSQIDRCGNCDQELTTIPISERSVAVDGCQNCSQGVVNVYYSPIPNRSADYHFQWYEEPDTTNGESSSQNSITVDAEKLTQNNVKKIDCNDKIRLKGSDGSEMEILVTRHNKQQEKIKGRKMNGGQNNAITLTYRKIFQRDGHVLFEFPEQREAWDSRADIPWDFPMSDSKNEKNFLECGKRGYIKTINFIKSSMEVISRILTGAVGKAAGILAKGLVIPAKVGASPFITMFYVGWGHDALKEKLASGIITEEEYVKQCEWYREYCGKAAFVAGCTVGGMAAMGVKWYLSNYVLPILLEELKMVWIAMTPCGAQIGIYIEQTILYIQAQSAVEGLQMLAMVYPRLGQLIALVGGPEIFLAVGAITLIFGGGLLGWYLHKKFTNGKALAKIAAEIKAEADKKNK